MTFKKFPVAILMAFAVGAAAIFAAISGLGSTSQIRWRSYGEGLQEARESNRKVLVDVYTDWCGWCKRMDRDTYADTGIVRYLSEHFVPVRLNAESARRHDVGGASQTERDVAERWGITGYPTTVFLTSAGEMIAPVPGYQASRPMRTLLQYVADEEYKTVDLQTYQSSHSGAN